MFRQNFLHTFTPKLLTPLFACVAHLCHQPRQISNRFLSKGSLIKLDQSLNFVV